MQRLTRLRERAGGTDDRSLARELKWLAMIQLAWGDESDSRESRRRLAEVQQRLAAAGS